MTLATYNDTRLAHIISSSFETNFENKNNNYLKNKPAYATILSKIPIKEVSQSKAIIGGNIGDVRFTNFIQNAKRTLYRQTLNKHPTNQVHNKAQNT